MARSALKLFSAGTLLGISVASVSGWAIAGTNRYHPVNCVVPGNDEDGIKRSTNYGAGNIGPSATNMVCPVDDMGGDFAKASATGFSVNVRDHTTSDYVGASACVDFRGGTGGSCTSTSSTGVSFSGWKTLTLYAPSGPTPWVTYYADYGYVSVRVPSGSPSAYSSVRGYTVPY